MTARPTFTLAGAATVTGKSRRTIGRMLEAGELDGAERDASGAWSIPVESLLAAGLTVHPPTPAEAVPAAPVQTDHDDVGAAAQVAEWRRRAEVAEAIAAERADALEDMRTALAIAQRMLAASVDAEPDRAAAGAEVQNVEPRRRWWRRSGPR